MIAYILSPDLAVWAMIPFSVLVRLNRCRWLHLDFTCNALNNRFSIMLSLVFVQRALAFKWKRLNDLLLSSNLTHNIWFLVCVELMIACRHMGSIVIDYLFLQRLLLVDWPCKVALVHLEGLLLLRWTWSLKEFRLFQVSRTLTHRLTTGVLLLLFRSQIAGFFRWRLLRCVHLLLDHFRNDRYWRNLASRWCNVFCILACCFPLRLPWCLRSIVDLWVTCFYHLFSIGTINYKLSLRPVDLIQSFL